MLHRSLELIGVDDLALYGGKAFRLAEAQKLGCPVPETVVLSTRLYSRFLEQGALDGEILSILSSMQPTAMHQFRAAEWAIDSAFSIRRMPSGVREAILDLSYMLDDGPVAVRSSTTSEGGGAHSFVGQHSTFTGITTRDELLAAVIGCWQSMFSARALHYAHRFGIDLLGSSMAVMVQHQIEPLREGALFTADPVSGSPDVFVMQSLDDGQADICRLDPYDLDSCHTELERELLRYGLLLDEHLEQYQVLEWVTDDSQTWVLRVLPITGAPLYIPPEPEPHVTVSRWNLINPNGRDTRKLPPYSWYHQSRAGDIRHALQPTLSKEEARAGESRFVKGYQYAPEVPARRRTGAGRLGRSVPAVLRQLALTAGTEREYANLYRSHKARLAEIWNRDWAHAENRELGEQLHKAVFLSHIYMTAGAKLVSEAVAVKALLKRICTEWAGKDMGVEQLLTYSSPAMVKLEAGAAALADDIEEDIELSEALLQAFWDERYLLIDPKLVEQMWDIALLYPDWEYLLRRAKECARTRECMPAALAEVDRERLRLSESVGQKLSGLHKALFNRLLCRAQALARLDAGRLEPVACALAAEHDILYEVGSRLEREGLAQGANEVALLDYRQVQDWLRGRMGDEVQDVISERRSLYRRWWRYRPPSVLTAHEGPQDPSVALIEGSGRGMKGMPVSPGKARGRVRVLHGPGESASLLAGEILVVDEPLTEYSSLFTMVSGVVCAGGSLLDHAATLAREYGVPAVFSLARATDVLKTGDVIQVDAFSGIVSTQPKAVSWDQI